MYIDIINIGPPEWGEKGTMSLQRVENENSHSRLRKIQIWWNTDI